MVTISNLRLQLATIGYRANIFLDKEIRDLARILSPDEEIIHCINGHYQGGLGIFVATNQRLLIVDHKPFFLTVDTVLYPMIQEISYNYRLLNTSVTMYTSNNKTLNFSSMNHHGMKAIIDYVQSQINFSRSYNIERQTQITRNIIPRISSSRNPYDV